MGRAGAGVGVTDIPLSRSDFLQRQFTMRLPLSSDQMDALVLWQILAFSSVVVSYSYGQVDDFAIAAASFFYGNLRMSAESKETKVLSCESRWTLVFFISFFNSVSLSTRPSDTKSQSGVLWLR
jgi:hypothetical protein